MNAIATSASRVRRFDLATQPVGSDASGRVPFQPQGTGDGTAEKRVTERGEDQPQGRLADMMCLMADAELGDEFPQRLKDGIERVAVARQDHPSGEGAGTFAIERVEGPVDHLARVGLMGAGARDRLGDAAGDTIGDRSCELGLESRRRAEMMEQVGMRAAYLGRDGLERNRLRTLLEKQKPRSFQRGGTALFGVEAFSAY